MSSCRLDHSYSRAPATAPLLIDAPVRVRPSTCGQRTAYHITKIVDADDVIVHVVDRLIARQIGFAEDSRRAIERFIHVDELDYLALGIESGADGTRAVILLYVCRDTDIVGPALN